MNIAQLTALLNHIEGMHDDAHFSEHPEWQFIVEEARALRKGEPAPVEDDTIFRRQFLVTVEGKIRTNAGPFPCGTKAMYVERMTQACLPALNACQEWWQCPLENPTLIVEPTVAPHLD